MNLAGRWRRALVDAGALTSANLIGAALGVAQGVIVARWLGPESYGVAVLLMAYPALLMTFFDARSSDATVKYLAEYRQADDARRAVAVCQLGVVVDVLTTVAALVAVLLTAEMAAGALVARPGAAFLLVVYSGSYVVRAVVPTAMAVLTNFGQFGQLAGLGLATNGLRVALVVGSVFAGYGAEGVVWANTIGHVASGVLHGGIALRLVAGHWRAGMELLNRDVLRGRWREILGFIAQNDLYAVVGIIPKQVDTVLLGFLSGSAEAGQYALAKSLTGAMGTIAGPLQSVAYARLVRMPRGIAMEAPVRDLARVALVASLAGTVVAIVFAGQLIGFVLGDQYLPAVAPARILLLGTGAWLAFFWLRPMLLATGRIHNWTIAVAGMGVAMLLLWWMLAPTFGAVGVAAGWSAAIVAGHVLVYAWLRRTPGTSTSDGPRRSVEPTSP